MKVQSENISYSAAGTQLRGYLAWDAENVGNQPGVLVFPEWWGLDDYIRQRAEQIASLGYVTMAADMYGHG